MPPHSRDIDHKARDGAAASTTSRTNVRDDRDTPFSRDGMARNKEMI
jgi:hypothetical protein